MSYFPIQNITIYHKRGTEWVRYVKEASFRNTSTQSHSKDGLNSSDDTTIRIFDVKGYCSTWFASKNDVIVNKEVSDTIEGQTPLSQLQKIYGDNNVYKIKSVDVFIFDDEDIKEINHIKLRCI